MPSKEDIVNEIERIDATTATTAVTEIICGRDVGNGGCTLGALRKQYRKKSLLIHPDRAGRYDARAEVCFKILHAALERAELAASYKAETADIEEDVDVHFFISEKLQFLPHLSDDDYIESVFEFIFPDLPDIFGEQRVPRNEWERFWGEVNTEKGDQNNDKEVIVIDDDEDVIVIDDEVKKVDNDIISRGTDDHSDVVTVRQTSRSQGKRQHESTSVLSIESSNRKCGARKNTVNHEVRKKYRMRALEKARSQLAAEKLAENSWVPRRAHEVDIVVGSLSNTRWECERLCREHTAWTGVQKGVKISKSSERVRMTCKNRGCQALLAFDRQPSSGQWKLNKWTNHMHSCSGEVESSDLTAKQCYPAYTAAQISRVVMSQVSDNLSVTTKEIRTIVMSKEIYRRRPTDRHFRLVREVILSQMERTRAVSMAAMNGYAQLLREYGHQCTVSSISGLEMKRVRMTAAQFIFRQNQKSGTIPKDVTFNPRVVDVSDISDHKRYYSGILFVPSTSTHFLQTARMTTTADAAHCQGIGPQSYGTMLQAAVYDANNHICPLVFAHSVRTECQEAWKPVFDVLKNMPGFDIYRRTTIVDQEKSIDAAFRSVMEKANLFLDWMHVTKNMASSIGSEKNIGVSLYQRALRASSIEKVQELKLQYGPKQSSYLGQFDDAELYKVHSKLEDTIHSSQGAESLMRASLMNNVRNVDPPKMLRNFVEKERSNFLKRKEAALKCTSPVPPHVERLLANLIQKARPYQQSVQFIDGTNMMEATVSSHSDPTIRRHVVINASPHTPPTCCSFSKLKVGIPCYHGAAVICEKHGSVNMFQFIAERHLTAAWKKQYEGLDFKLPSEDKIEKVYAEAHLLVSNGDNLSIPLAIAPPRGRPVKEAGKRRKSWFERGPSRKRRRTYNCSYCSQEGHNSLSCPLRQGIGHSRVQQEATAATAQTQPSPAIAQTQPPSTDTKS